MKVKGQSEKKNGPRLNINKNKQMTVSAIASHRPDNKDSEGVDSFCLLGLTINCKETSRQEVYHGLALGRIVMKSSWIFGSIFVFIYLVG